MNKFGGFIEHKLRAKLAHNIGDMAGTTHMLDTSLYLGVCIGHIYLLCTGPDDIWFFVHLTDSSNDGAANSKDAPVTARQL